MNTVTIPAVNVTKFTGFKGVKVTKKNSVAKSKQLVPVDQVVKSLKSQVVEQQLNGKTVKVYNPTRSKDAKTYSAGGVSIWRGIMKVRFANSVENRIKVLQRNEHTDVRIVQVTPGTKAEVAQQLLTHEDFQDKWAQNTIQAFIQKNS